MHDCLPLYGEIKAWNGASGSATNYVNSENSFNVAFCHCPFRLRTSLNADHSNVSCCWLLVARFSSLVGWCGLQKASMPKQRCCGSGLQPGLLDKMVLTTGLKPGATCCRTRTQKTAAELNPRALYQRICSLLFIATWPDIKRLCHFFSLFLLKMRFCRFSPHDSCEGKMLSSLRKHIS